MLRYSTRQITHNILGTFKTLGEVLLDESVNDQELRKTMFDHVDRGTLVSQMNAVDIWLSGKYSHPFNLVVQRHSYLRQFAPTFLAHLEFHQEEGVHSPVIEAIQLLQELDDQNKRKLPEDAPLGFLSRTLRPQVVQNGTINKRAWECALLTAIRDEVKSGNLYVHQSKRFGRFENFFISKAQWEFRRKSFFERAELPIRAEEVEAHLTQRLNRAYDRFLKFLPDNTYASIKDDQWALSSDPAEKSGEAAEQRLAELRAWLSEHLRTIKLADLLIEVDNELGFTRTFMTSAQQKQRQAEHVCLILAAIMAHGCNIGPYTMAQLTDDVSYEQIRRVTDWQLTEEAQRSALAQVVNAISRLDVSQAWGSGKTSSSDGQRFSLNQRVLQQTYSHKLRDFALEFYSFIADNYSPFYSTAIECTDRDAAYVLDGLLYNESDLALEEHYTDTHGYTEINFAAFAMLGRRFAQRIRGLHKQRIYRIDDDKDYGPLVPLIERRDRLIHLD